MATKPTKHCDIYPETTKDVETFSVQVLALGAVAAVVDRDIDLCPRARTRLVNFLNRGMATPKPPAATAKPTPAGGE